MLDDPGKTVHFETLDHGKRRIICTVLDWEHVCRKPHEYMEGEEQEVIDALAKPDHGIRHLDSDNALRRIIYYKTNIPKKCYVKVVVEFQDDKCIGDGRIITANEANNIKDSEKPELKI
jgi:hypothetical protein